jgi:hypothetical protein
MKEPATVALMEKYGFSVPKDAADRNAGTTGAAR